MNKFAEAIAMDRILKAVPIVLVLVASTCFAQSADWKAEQVADALRAAPPTVTRDAKIYAWHGTKLTLVRDGNGPYTCVASGSYSLRLGKPALPYPDSFCADQNAWSFIQAFWAEEDPMHPAHQLPRAPGLVWMLAGMNVVGGKVAYGKDEKSSVTTGPAHAGHANSGTDIVDMTPHIMILPLAVQPDNAHLPGTYDPETPIWIMAPGTPTTHLHVHFSDPVYKALMALQ